MTIALSWNILPKRSRAILSENGQKSETPSSHFLMIEPIQYAAVSAISKPDTKCFFVRKTALIFSFFSSFERYIGKAGSMYPYLSCFLNPSS